jgi:hypothetical protein
MKHAVIFLHSVHHPKRPLPPSEERPFPTSFGETDWLQITQVTRAANSFFAAHKAFFSLFRFIFFCFLSYSSSSLFELGWSSSTSPGTTRYCSLAYCWGKAG